jgi:hypothetical protein
VVQHAEENDEIEGALRERGREIAVHEGDVAAPRESLPCLGEA